MSSPEKPLDSDAVDPADETKTDETKKPRPIEPLHSHKTQTLDVLVAEDNEVNQMVMEQILDDLGLNFKIVDDGTLAVANFKANSPSIILMDVSMPEMDGKQATKSIRQIEQLEKLEHTPIIGLTAHALAGDKEACIEAGMDDYITKPVSPADLAEKIKHWLAIVAVTERDNLSA